MNNTFDDKEKELNTQFDNEKNAATAIEEQIKELQTKLQEKMSNLIRLQGAFALLMELKTTEEKKEEEPEKKK